MNYCQDGLQVYYATATRRSGHYELQPNDVNGRPYFKMGSYGLWYDGLGHWWISHNSIVGQSLGYAYYKKDVFCPHQLSELNWVLSDGTGWSYAGNDLTITCKLSHIHI